MPAYTTGSRGWSSFAADDGPLFIRITNLMRGSLEMRFHNVIRLNLPETSEVARSRIEPGDVLASVTAYIGSVAVATCELGEAYVSQHVARCRPLAGQSSMWLGYNLLSRVGQTHGQLCLYGGTKDGLSLDDVRNYPVLLPPRSEQHRIVRWIERKTEGLARATKGIRRQVDSLGEYRTRLIADVVTGKLDVREATTNLPEGDLLEADSSAPLRPNKIEAQSQRCPMRK